MRTLTTITPPTTRPVSVSDLAAHLRLNTEDEQGQLADWIDAATSLFERTTGYCPITQTWRLHLDGWPSCMTVLLPRGPVTTVDTLEYLDNNDDWQEIEDGWAYDTSGPVARVVLPSSLPSLHDRHRPRVRVTFTAGHATAADVPVLIRQAIKLMASHMYEQREAYTTDNLEALPAGWKAVCDQYQTGLLDMGQNGEVI